MLTAADGPPRPFRGTGAAESLEPLETLPQRPRGQGSATTSKALLVFPRVTSRPPATAPCPVAAAGEGPLLLRPPSAPTAGASSLGLSFLCPLLPASCYF